MRTRRCERRGPWPHPCLGAACQPQNSTVEARRRRATDAETWTIVIRIFEKLDFAIFVQLVTRRRLEPVVETRLRGVRAWARGVGRAASAIAEA